jgi:hypothetical protein
MFILHTPNSSKPTSIIFKKVLSDGPCRESVSESILPTHWDKEAQRAIITDLDKKTTEVNKSINALLGKITGFIEDRTRDARYTSNHLTVEEMKNKLQELTGRVKERKGSGFYPKCREIIADMEVGTLLTPRGKVYASETIRGYKRTVEKLEEYDSKLTWGAVDSFTGPLLSGVMTKIGA